MVFFQIVVDYFFHVILFMVSLSWVRLSGLLRSIVVSSDGVCNS